MPPNNPYQNNPENPQNQNMSNQYSDPQPPQQTQPGQPVVVVSPNQPQPSQPVQQNQPSIDYDFIVNPIEKPRPKLFENTNSLTKYAIIGGGVLILLIIFNIIRGLISGPSIGEKFLVVAQDQQQLLALVEGANQQQGISATNANSAITTKLSIGTSQAATIEYMAKNGKKAKPKDLSLMLDGKLTEQLEASAAAGTYNETYAEIMSRELNAYMDSMSVLYKQIKGKNGQALLDKNYMSAKLLLQQLEQT